MYLFISFLTGIIVVLQMKINSYLSERLDSFSSIFYHYFTASIILFLFYLFKFRELYSKSSLLLDISPNMYLGSICGIFIVFTANIAYRKFSPLYSTSCMIFAQLLTGLILDKISGVTIADRKFFGVFIIILGIIYNSYITSKKATVVAP